MTVLATYRKQTIQPEILSRLVVLNRMVMKLDPTRTTTLRNSFVAEVDKRFNALKKLITEAIVDRDCFGLKPGNEGKLITFAVPGANQNDPLPAKEQYKFNTSSEKVDEFMGWLNTQEEKGILQTTRLNQVGTAAREPWTNVYITDSYKKGRQRAVYEMKGVGMQPPEGMGISMGFAANTPFHADRVGLLYTRTFNDLKGIDQAMDSQISRILAQGLADGDGPKELARKINQKVDGIGKNRARTLARTEVIRAHHSGMIGEYRNWGAIGVKVQAEWVTAGFNVCPECQAMEGKEFTLDQIERMIPKHPNCRCIALPTMPEKQVVGEPVIPEKKITDTPTAPKIKPTFETVLEAQKVEAARQKKFAGEYTTVKHEKVKRLEDLTGLEFKLYEQSGSFYGNKGATKIRVSNHPSKFVEKAAINQEKAIDLNYEALSITDMYNKINEIDPFKGMEEGIEVFHRRAEAVGRLLFLKKEDDVVFVKVIKAGRMTTEGEVKKYYADMFTFFDKD